MNERERWIVYPLLFFALGAALRDKFLQQVSTKEIACQRLVAEQIECAGGVLCQGMIVLDAANPNQRLVELGQLQPVANMPGQPSQRYGVLILRDSQGQEICGVSNNELFVRKINCEGLTVVDPENHQRALAALSSMLRGSRPGDPLRRFGVLALNNQAFWQLMGLPPAAAVTPRESAEDDEGAGDAEDADAGPEGGDESREDQPADPPSGESPPSGEAAQSAGPDEA
jgi:hypothetical protein